VIAPGASSTCSIRSRDDKTGHDRSWGEQQLSLADQGFDRVGEGLGVAVDIGSRRDR
jgi:hypothetical protein